MSGRMVNWLITQTRHSVVSIQTCVLFRSVEMLHNNEIRPITKVMGIILLNADTWRTTAK